MRHVRQLIVWLTIVLLFGLLINVVGRLALVAVLHRLSVSTESIEVIEGTFFPLLGYLLIVVGSLFVLLEVLESLIAPSWVIRINSGMEVELKKELNRATARAEAEPEKIKPAWDLARVKLELYIDRNLNQGNYI